MPSANTVSSSIGKRQHVVGPGERQCICVSAGLTISPSLATGGSRRGYVGLRRLHRSRFAVRRHALTSARPGSWRASAPSGAFGGSGSGVAASGCAYRLSCHHRLLQPGIVRTHRRHQVVHRCERIWKNGLGYSPIQKAIITSGTNVASSPPTGPSASRS